jgi:hypothetical protein
MQTVTVKLPVSRPKVRLVSVDDLENFAKVKRVKISPRTFTSISEALFKKGCCAHPGREGSISGLGRESPTTCTRHGFDLAGRRIAAAFAFKGPGKKGILTPGKMGKHGNQIQRLFRIPASLYMVQYWGQIAEDVVEQLRTFAVAKAAIEGERCPLA